MWVKSFVTAFLAFLTTSGGVCACELQPVPVNRSEWMARHSAYVQQARYGGARILFLGDSITDYWRNDGLPLWNQVFAPLRALNFGIGGDRVENVLWRIENGELEGLNPQAIVLLIGTNNLPDNTVDEISAGHARLVAEIHARLPNSHLLVLGIFPRVDDWSIPFREKIAPINALLSREADGRSIHYLDIGSSFQNRDGGISPAIMGDGLHLTTQGYSVWVDAMLPTLRAFLGGAPVSTHLQSK